MINKNLYTAVIFLFLFLEGCGYQPILSSKGSFFSIKEIELVQKNKINKNIKNVLKIYQNKSDTNKLYDLRIGSQKNKVTLTKDSKGNPKILSVTIVTEVEIKENNVLKNTKNFTKTLSYNNDSNKFSLKRYEEKIELNLTNKIIEEIIIYLQSI